MLAGYQVDQRASSSGLSIIRAANVRASIPFERRAQSSPVDFYDTGGVDFELIRPVSIKLVGRGSSIKEQCSKIVRSPATSRLPPNISHAMQELFGVQFAQKKTQISALWRRGQADSRHCRGRLVEAMARELLVDLPVHA